MVRMASVVACADSGVYWDRDIEPAMCMDSDHDHQVFPVHYHLDVVVLPDGTELTAVSFDPASPYSRDHQPDFGLYLDPRWQPPWDHSLLDWPDFGVPSDLPGLRRSMSALLDRARSGERVEVGCSGGHGRTGTALACLAALAGHPAGDAVSWVRTYYCPEAIETPAQQALPAAMDQL